MPKHCDDYINDPAAPAALRIFLARAREPAHGRLRPDPYPKLYATYNGERVRVTVASRFGDVGITARLDCEVSYDERVHVEELTDFSEAP